MYRKILGISVLLLCFTLSSCLGVFYIDLGNHYAWLEDRIIVKIKEETEESIYYDILIRPQVLNFDYDDKYIIAYQVYDGGAYYSIDPRVEGRDSLMVQFAKLKKLKHCYWIIDKETGVVMGPMRKPEFESRCEELHVEAKMHRFHEKKFWEGMEDLLPDSSRNNTAEEVVDTLTKGKYTE